jgi:hypothetical protein
MKELLCTGKRTKNSDREKREGNGEPGRDFPEVSVSTAYRWFHHVPKNETIAEFSEKKRKLK